jgi:ribonuclease D
MQHNPWIVVSTQSEAEEARQDIGSSTVICMDTEYDSLRYFREKLCLIQIRADRKTYLFDPLGDLDLSFLGQYFAAPSLLKVVHAGDNDIRILKRDYGFIFKNIFDTYRAASLLGSRHLSLANVVVEYLGIEFEKQKKMQRSRWDLRPLTAEQLHYAALDTAHLPALYLRLEEDLQKAGLEEEAARVFADMTKIKWHKKDLDKDGYKKIARYYTLTDQQKERLKYLFRWRYGKAKEINRAIFMVLSDQDLVELSALEVGSVHELKASGFLPGEKLHLFGAELVELLDRGGENAGFTS